MEPHESLWSLLTDVNHWIFELILMAIFDGIIGLVVWPRIRQFGLHHKTDDQRIDELEQQVQALKDKLAVLQPLLSAYADSTEDETRH